MTLGAVIRLDDAHASRLDHERQTGPPKTLETLRPYFPELGITRLGEITGLDVLGIPVAFACRPNSFSLSISLGRGRDRESALTAAAMEAAEAAIAERLPSDHIHASILDLRGRGKSILDLTS